jgi:antitoxin MazE
LGQRPFETVILSCPCQTIVWCLRPLGGVFIVKSFAAETRIEQDIEVELSIDEGRLIISTAAPRCPTLEELLEGVTAENLHGEFETGPAVGGEAW